MKAVVLLGFWTAGKTSAVKRLRERLGERVSFIDTDEMVSEHYGGWINNIYLALARDGDALKAHDYVDFRERYVLSRLLSVVKPCIIAAGPLIPTREPYWSAFVEHVKPVCFHLRVAPHEMYTGLKRRREWQQRTGLDLCPGFGSWDEGLLTRYNSATGSWEEMAQEEALENLERVARELTPAYQRWTRPNLVFSANQVKVDPLARRRFEEAVAEQLGVATTPFGSLFDASPGQALVRR